MVRKIDAPTTIAPAGNLPKIIHEYVGRVNTGNEGVSVALMQSPAGWQEPAQTPEFMEITLVLEGCVEVHAQDDHLYVHANEAVVTMPGERVRYETPEGARYVAICLPAFSPDTVHRDAEPPTKNASATDTP